MSYSKHFSPLSLRGIARAGDLLVPGDQKLPRFSKSPAILEIDRIADWMAPQDRDGFKFLSALFGVLPRWMIRALLQLAEKADAFPNWISPPFRLINLGVKGVIYTLYYTDSSASQPIRRELNWSTRCGPLDSRNLSETEQRVEEAFRKSRAGSQQLRKMPLRDRLKYLAPLRELLFKHQEKILDEIQRATGKSRSDAYMSEIFAVLDHLKYLETTSEKFLRDRTVPSGLALLGKTSQVWFEPLGTVLCISPWNYPFYQALVPITSALACGNSVVYKPSELTPMTGLVESLLREAGIPEDWVQVVYGDGQVGRKLIDQRPDKIFFIGSSSTGKKILEQAAKYLIPVELELGGKDPALVFDDANIQRSVAGIAWGALTNTGQSCTSVERVYVQEGIFEKFLETLIQDCQQIVQKVDTDGSSDIGDMTSEAQVKVIAEHLQDALQKGATLHTGISWDRKSMRIPPLVLTGVNHEMTVMREESFGPFIPLMPFKTEAEGIQLANDSPYGLSASVWTQDMKRAQRVARALITGNVSINNVMLTEGNHALPFGGAKQSGFGRYKGEFGFYAFSNVKAVILDQNSKKIEANWYPYTAKKYGLFQGMTRGLFGAGLKGLLQFASNGLPLESLAQKKRGNS
jgi:acyl-CoA reductase-like NAD-dependent aldehyde dehydrogenase